MQPFKPWWCNQPKIKADLNQIWFDKIWCDSNLIGNVNQIQFEDQKICTMWQKPRIVTKFKGVTLWHFEMSQNVTKCHSLLNLWYKTTFTFCVWISLGTPLGGFHQIKCDLERDLRRDWPTFKSNVNLHYRKVVTICIFMLDIRLGPAPLHFFLNFFWSRLKLNILPNNKVTRLIWIGLSFCGKLSWACPNRFWHDLILLNSSPLFRKASWAASLELEITLL